MSEPKTPNRTASAATPAASVAWDEAAPGRGSNPGAISFCISLGDGDSEGVEGFLKDSSIVDDVADEAK